MSTFVTWCSKDIQTLQALHFFVVCFFFPFSFPCRFEQWQRFWFLQCFRGLGSDQPAKDKQWKAFSPRPFIHNKHKVEAVTLTPTWKLSRAEVSIERKKILPLGSGRVAEHIVFIYLFYFSWQGRGELSFSFFFPFFSSGREKKKGGHICWQCCGSALIRVRGLLCQETFCGRQERNLVLWQGPFLFFLKGVVTLATPPSWNGGHCRFSRPDWGLKKKSLWRRSRVKTIAKGGYRIFFLKLYKSCGVWERECQPPPLGQRDWPKPLRRSARRQNFFGYVPFIEPFLHPHTHLYVRCSHMTVDF